MGRPPFPTMSCVICRKPVDLHADLCADENGKAVHTDCYVKRITGVQEHSSVRPCPKNLRIVRRNAVLEALRRRLLSAKECF